MDKILALPDLAGLSRPTKPSAPAKRSAPSDFSSSPLRRKKPRSDWAGRQSENISPGNADSFGSMDREYSSSSLGCSDFDTDLEMGEDDGIPKHASTRNSSSSITEFSPSRPTFISPVRPKFVTPSPKSASPFVFSGDWLEYEDPWKVAGIILGLESGPARKVGDVLSPEDSDIMQNPYSNDMTMQTPPQISQPNYNRSPPKTKPKPTALGLTYSSSPISFPSSLMDLAAGPDVEEEHCGEDYERDVVFEKDRDADVDEKDCDVEEQDDRDFEDVEQKEDHDDLDESQPKPKDRDADVEEKDCDIGELDDRYFEGIAQEEDHEDLEEPPVKPLETPSSQDDDEEEAEAEWTVFKPGPKGSAQIKPFGGFGTAPSMAELDPVDDNNYSNQDAAVSVSSVDIVEQAVGPPVVESRVFKGPSLFSDDEIDEDSDY
ncbi:hypothetical protein C8J56DRAFT_938694 [Mycena floridula]|nr:hypothetical protein C8J56DRAFT_938694 [Mycena floridula]